MPLNSYSVRRLSNLSSPMHRREEDFLLADLQSAGYSVASVWDWVNSPAPPGAIPILVRHLVRVEDEKLVEALARALTTRGNPAALPALFNQFRRVRSPEVGWAIANAIVTIGFRPEHWPTVLELAAEPRYGRARQPMVQSLRHVRLPEVQAVLHGLLHEPEVAAFAAAALGYCGTDESHRHLVALDVSSGTPLLRREVRKALQRLEERLLIHSAEPPNPSLQRTTPARSRRCGR